MAYADCSAGFVLSHNNIRRFRSWNEFAVTKDRISEANLEDCIVQTP